MTPVHYIIIILAIVGSVANVAQAGDLAGTLWPITAAIWCVLHGLK